jgi:extradiol dioxygenase family protein
VKRRHARAASPVRIDVRGEQMVHHLVTPVEARAGEGLEQRIGVMVECAVVEPRDDAALLARRGDEQRVEPREVSVQQALRGVFERHRHDSIVTAQRPRSLRPG